MSWIEKHQRAKFEDLPIEGLHFLDGDIFARYLADRYGKVDVPFFNPDWLKNQKLPQIEFPSGESFDLWETSHPKSGGIVHLYGEMDLPYFDTRDQAWAQANAIAQQVGYGVYKRDEHQLEVIGHDDDEHFILTYHPQEHRLMDIAKVPPRSYEQRQTRREPLLDEASRNRLPELYANEHLGLEALAQVKFFDPESNWTWYASEASAILKDGTRKKLSDVDLHNVQVETVIFFGLVNGFELEMGYFSLAELEQLTQGKTVFIERDHHFAPTTLQSLYDYHLKQ